MSATTKIQPPRADEIMDDEDDFEDLEKLRLDALKTIQQKTKNQQTINPTVPSIKSNPVDLRRIEVVNSNAFPFQPVGNSGFNAGDPFASTNFAPFMPMNNVQLSPRSAAFVADNLNKIARNRSPTPKRRSASSWSSSRSRSSSPNNRRYSRSRSPPYKRNRLRRSRSRSPPLKKSRSPIHNPNRFNRNRSNSPPKYKRNSSKSPPPKRISKFNRNRGGGAMGGGSPNPRFLNNKNEPRRFNRNGKNNRYQNAKNSDTKYNNSSPKDFERKSKSPVKENVESEVSVEKPSEDVKMDEIESVKSNKSDVTAKTNDNQNEEKPTPNPAKSKREKTQEELEDELLASSNDDSDIDLDIDLNDELDLFASEESESENEGRFKSSSSNSNKKNIASVPSFTKLGKTSSTNIKDTLLDSSSSTSQFQKSRYDRSDKNTSRYSSNNNKRYLSDNKSSNKSSYSKSSKPKITVSDEKMEKPTKTIESKVEKSDKRKDDKEKEKEKDKEKTMFKSTFKTVESAVSVVKKDDEKNKPVKEERRVLLIRSKYGKDTKENSKTSPTSTVTGVSTTSPATTATSTTEVGEVTKAVSTTNGTKKSIHLRLGGFVGKKTSSGSSGSGTDTKKPDWTNEKIKLLIRQYITPYPVKTKRRIVKGTRPKSTVTIVLKS